MEKKSVRDQEQTIYKAFSTSDFYQLLSLSIELPSKVLVEALVDGSYKQDGINILKELSCSQYDVLQVEKAFDQLIEDQQDMTRLLNQMRNEHTRLFYDPKRPSLGIYETVFLGKENSKDIVLFVSSAAQDAERCYKEAGVTLKNKSLEPADHIGTELEFLMFLYRNKGLAMKEKNYEGLEEVEQQIKQFEDCHLGKWSYDFFENLERESQLQVYKAIALLAKAGLRQVLYSPHKVSFPQ